MLGTGQGRSGELWGGTRSFKQKRDFLLLYLTWEVPQLGESIVQYVLDKMGISAKNSLLFVRGKMGIVWNEKM